MPAALVYGADEEQVERDDRARFAELRPDLPLTLIPRARANPELELPAETIATIEQLVDELVGAEGGA